MGKYLPPELDDVFNEVIKGPDDSFKPPTWLLKAIQEVAEIPAHPLRLPPVKFVTDGMSLAHNAKLLERFDFDLAELLDHFADTTLGHGSEFRPTEQLDRIF
jgi:hypothetical protein